MTILEALTHNPVGIEHPYHQDPDERFPRQPLAGQAVELGARTFPPTAARHVWATWNAVDGSGINDKGLSEAALIARGGTEAETMQFATSTIRMGGTRAGDTWRAALPAFSHGQQICYQLHAFPADGNEQLDSPKYSFTVMDWIATDQVTGYELDAEGLTIFFSASRPQLQTSLQVHLTDTEQLSFSLRASSQPTFSGKLEASFLPPSWRALEQEEDRIRLIAGELSLELTTQPFYLQISREGKVILATSTPPGWLVGSASESPTMVRMGFDSPAAESFHGLGERYNAFNLRGSTLDALVYEQYKNQGVHTYIPVPFFLSSQGYGFYLETARFSTFDLAASRTDRWHFQAEIGSQASLNFHVYAGKEPRYNLQMFSHQVGLPQLPPDWAFGHWISSNEWNSQATVLEQVRLSNLHDIPASVLVIEAWADEKTFYIWNDAQYVPKPADHPFQLADLNFPADGLWPDPKGMIDELHRQGIRLLLWQIPVLKDLGGERHPQQDIDEAYMLEKGYHLKWPDGSPYRVRPFWFHDSLLLDFNNPEAVDWWMSKRAYLLEELGVDGFKTDGGEHLWGRDVTFANGLRGDEGLNLYSNLYVGAYHRFARKKRDGDALTFSRAGFTGAQAFPCHWAGDENSTWEAFRASLSAGLNAGLSGIPFWGWDIAGFSGEIPSAELYLRAAAMAAFCPIMQYHSEFNDHRKPLRDRTPWNIAERTGRPEVIDIYRHYTKTRMRLLPYITAEARYCSETGEPLMRPLFLDWHADPQAWQISDQYCFGRALMIAPVLEPGTDKRHLYLPEGHWQEFWTGAKFSGQQWITVPAPLEQIPVFKRLDQAWQSPLP
jgi:alpha-glucosidase (family GH31 glycosyl hydrolase)